MIQDVDFAPYLASMHYENMGLPASSYKGYLGLIKVIEIHSLRHIRWGTSEQYPFYYPGMY
jgi:hypothetical protein